MKFVLRKLSDGLFYRSPREWVRSAKEATTVEDVGHALELSKGQDLADLELLGVSEEGRPCFGHHLQKLAEAHSHENSAAPDPAEPRLPILPRDES